MESLQGQNRNQSLIRWVASTLDMVKITRRCFNLFAYWSALGAMPLVFDRDNLTVFLTASKTKWFLYLLLTSISFSVGVHQAITFVLLITDKKSFRPDHVGIHFIIGAVPWLNVAIGRKYYFSEPEALTYFMNAAQKYYRDRNQLLSKGSTFQNTGPVPRVKVNLQRLVLAILPLALPAFCVLAMLMISIDCSRKMHLYYIFDREGECTATSVNSVTYLISFVLQAVVPYHSCTAFLCLYLHMMGIEYMNDRILEAKERFRKSIKTSSQTDPCVMLSLSVSKLRQSELTLRAFNVANSGPLFYLKQYELCTSVLGWYTAIGFFSENLAAGILGISAGFYAALAYAVSYEKAYLIPCHMDDFKRHVWSEAANVSLFPLIKRHVSSIHSDGVRVGSFSIIDRLTIPVFIDFSTTQVASLLITFKRS